MWKFLKKLLGYAVDHDEQYVPGLNYLSPPSAEAIARRDRKAKAAIKKMGSKYLNVAFKKETGPEIKTDNVRQLKGVAK